MPSSLSLHQFVGERVREKRAQMNDGKLDEVEKKPMIQRLLEHRLPDGALLTERDVVAEHMGHLCVRNHAKARQILTATFLT